MHLNILFLLSVEPAISSLIGSQDNIIYNRPTDTTMGREMSPEKQLASFKTTWIIKTNREIYQKY